MLGEKWPPLNLSFTKWALTFNSSSVALTWSFSFLFRFQQSGPKQPSNSIVTSTAIPFQTLHEEKKQIFKQSRPALTNSATSHGSDQKKTNEWFNHHGLSGLYLAPRPSPNILSYVAPPPQPSLRPPYPPPLYAVEL